MPGENEFTSTDEAALSAAEETPVAPAADEGAPTQAKAEAAVESKWNEILARNNGQNEADELEESGATSPDNPDGEEKPAPEAKDDDEKETVADDEVDEGTADDKSPEAVARKKTLDGFDGNLKQIAKQLGGWQDKDIDDFIVSNPVLARVTFSKIAEGYNALSLQYARGSRPVQSPAQQPAQQTGATSGEASVLDQLLSDPKKLAQLQEVAGEELTNAFIKPLLEERKAMQEDRQYIATMRREAVVREINDSFTHLAGESFKEFYGKNGETTQDQQNNRFKVGQLADQIRAGAQSQGVDMSIQEALNRAHLIVTADLTRQTARKEVQSAVKKRSTQITQRPTGRKSSASAAGVTSVKGDEAALAAVADFWDGRG